MRVSATASQSTYAGIIRLVQAAEASKAPLVRLADRYALRATALQSDGMPYGVLNLCRRLAWVTRPHSHATFKGSA